MRPVEVIIPEGTVVNARPPAAVAGGNVETSQRVVDVLLRAFSKILPNRIPAASSGTMNNVTIGGIDPRTGELYAYYEAIAGGSGACSNRDGTSGIHTHMTNSLNTPVEALEYAYPFRVRRYSYRNGSHGNGKYRGGDGLIREIELLGPAQVTLLTERRVYPPYGVNGGLPGLTGRNILIENGVERDLPAKCNIEVDGGAVLRIETPGGGGWGEPAVDEEWHEDTNTGWPKQSP
jgi:N-methylhydantoinase B